jgi:hypothetical protein
LSQCLAPLSPNQSAKNSGHFLACPAPGVLRRHDKRSAPEHKRLVTYGRLFDPDNIDLPTINARIGKLARR